MIADPIDWLLEGDPAIRWQVLRDLAHSPQAEVAAERRRVAYEGWGARLLELQAAEGDFGDNQRHGWMPTNDAPALLKLFGADPGDRRVAAAIGRIRERIFWWQLDGRPFFDGETEACINGRILGSGAYFGAPTQPLLDRLLGEQLADGGWNCEAPPSVRSSFHSTICVLEGLLAHEQRHGPTPDISSARARGEAYLLDRRMLRSLSRGTVIDEGWTRFSFPPVWHYDVLRGLDYLRGAGAAPDERVAEAIDLVQARRGPDGRWPLDTLHRDRLRLRLEIEPDIGHPSRWNTLRALRVLAWHADG